MTNDNYIIKQNKISISSFILIIFMIYGISGYTGFGNNFILLSGFLFWVFIAFIESPKYLFTAIIKKQNICLIIFISYYFLTGLYNSSILYLSKYVGIFLIHYLSTLYFNYYYAKKSYEILKILAVSCLAIWLFFCIKAIIFYQINPSAARVLAADFHAFDTIAIGGGYNLAFGSALLSVFYFEGLITGDINGRSNRVTAYLILTILIILILKTESTLTFIAMVIGFLISIIKKAYYGKKNKNYRVSIIRKSTIILLILITLLLAIIFMNDIGECIMELSVNNLDKVIFRRIHRMGEKLKYFGSSSNYYNYIDLRFATISNSFKSFLSSPILGNGYKYGHIFALGDNYNISGHSEFIDILARYGIIGGTPLILVYFYAVRENKNRRYSSFYTYISTMIFMCIVNPFQTFHSLFALFFMIPLLSWYYSNERMNNDAYKK